MGDMKLAMVCRGLLLTLSYSDMGSTSWHQVTLNALKIFVQVTTTATGLAKTYVDLVIAHQPKIIFIELIT